MNCHWRITKSHIYDFCYILTAMWSTSDGWVNAKNSVKFKPPELSISAKSKRLFSFAWSCSGQKNIFDELWPNLSFHTKNIMHVCIMQHTNLRDSSSGSSRTASSSTFTVWPCITMLYSSQDTRPSLFESNSGKRSSASSNAYVLYTLCIHNVISSRESTEMLCYSNKCKCSHIYTKLKLTWWKVFIRICINLSHYIQQSPSLLGWAEFLYFIFVLKNNMVCFGSL